MKKVLLFSFVVLAGSLLVSCKKDRVCECKYGGQSYEVTYLDASKRQAKDACISQKQDIGGGTVVEIECELK